MVRIVRHKEPVYAIAWNHDGSQLHTGARDGVVRTVNDDRSPAKSEKVSNAWLTTLVVHDRMGKLFAGDSAGNCRPLDW